MQRLIAFCGIDCAHCPAYVATQANDLAEMERILAKWRTEFSSPEMTLASITCDGCTSKARHGGYCGQCAVRACAAERGVSSCAACSDYSCSKLDTFIGSIPDARANLESLRNPK